MTSDPPSSMYNKYPESPTSPLPRDEGQFGNPYCRWTILFAALVLSIATLPLWLSFVIPKKIAYVNAIIIGAIALYWLSIAVCALRNFSKMYRQPIPQTIDEESVWRGRAFKHVVIVPCYLDPLDILIKCVGTLATQVNAKDLIVVVTFERKTPELMLKTTAIQSHFSNSFHNLLVVRHTLLPGTEIPGGCSNKNYALREAYKYVSNNFTPAQIEQTRLTLTTCDTDSLFHPRYFEVLEACYNAENPSDVDPVKMVVWQPPLFYNWDLDERPFFNRVTGLMRMMMMMGSHFV